MQIDSILFILAVLILVVFYISQPFNRVSVHVGAEEQSLSALLAERDRILDALSELDFDNELGKIPAEIYPDQRADLVRHGAEIMRKLDNLPNIGIDAELEAIIDSRRTNQTKGSESEDLESMIAARKESSKSKVGKFCFNCGEPIILADKFCAHCGTELS